MVEFLLFLVLLGVIFILVALQRIIRNLETSGSRVCRDASDTPKPPLPWGTVREEPEPAAVEPEPAPVRKPQPPVWMQEKPQIEPRPAFSLPLPAPEAIKMQTAPLPPRLKICAPLPPPPRKAKCQPLRRRSEFEMRALELWRKVWSWLIVGEEFRPRNVATEYSVATAWLVRGAFALILFGIASFIKYSYDNRLMSPEWRMVIATLIGVGMLASGARLHGKRYQGIGMGLQGAGIVTLYFAGFASYSVYHLLPAWAAFGGMGLVTAIAAALAVRQNALLIAVIGSLGGYATPFLLADTVLPAPVFCGYLLLLAAGLTAVARFREWKLLQLITLPGSYFVYGFLANQIDWVRSYPWLISYLSICFVLFSWQTIFYNLRHRQKITLFELLLLVVNYFFYLGMGIDLIRQVASNEMAALVPLGTALFFSAEIILFLKWKIQDRILLLLLLVLAALSLALVFPLALSGKWITAAWSLQALAMLYLAIRIRSNVLRGLAMVLYFVAGFRISGMDLTSVFVRDSANYWAGMYGRFFSLGSYTLSLLAGAWLLNQSAKSHLRPGFLAAVDGSDFPASEDFGDRRLSNGFLWFGAILGLIYLWGESSRLGREFFAPLTPWLQGYLLIGMLTFILWRQRRALAAEHRQVLLGVAVLFSIVATAYLMIAQVVPFYVRKPYVTEYGFCRLAEFIPVCGLLVWYGWRSRKEGAEAQIATVLFTVLGIGLWFLYSSMELYRAMEVAVPDFRNGAVSVLWGIYAVLLVAIGVGCRFKSFRMVGLLLFTVTAAKIFLVDLARLATLYRIIAFVGIGIAMLIGAFLYMRFRDIFTREENESGKE